MKNLSFYTNLMVWGTILLANGPVHAGNLLPAKLSCSLGGSSLTSDRLNIDTQTMKMTLTQGDVHPVTSDLAVLVLHEDSQAPAGKPFLIALIENKDLGIEKRIAIGRSQSGLIYLKTNENSIVDFCTEL